MKLSVRATRFLLVSIILLCCLQQNLAFSIAGKPANTGSTREEASKQILKGKVICIDAGHQNKANYKTEPVAPGSKVMKAKTSSGTSGISTKTPEYKLNLEVALLLQEELEAMGAEVVMTRTENDVSISNIERAEIANKANACLTIRIHADGSGNNKVNGISMQIPGGKYLKDKNLISESENAGKVVLDAVVKSTGAKSGGLVVRNDLTGFNWSKVPVILIEMGFMTNREEDRKLGTKEYKAKIVSGIAEGIRKYLEE